MKKITAILALVCLLFTLVPGVTGQPKEESIPWTAKPDPLPYQLPAAQPVAKPIALGKNGDMVFPTSSSQFGCAVIPVAKMPSELRMIDLSKVEQVGQSVKAEGVSIASLCVSPYGDFAAAMESKTEKPTVKIFTFDGKEPRSFVVSETKVPIEIDFASKGKILVVKHIHDIKNKIYTHIFETWDIASSKMVGSFDYGIESYDPRWCGFSPGRNYLAMEQNSNAGYFFLIFNLTTGKQAGKIEVQPKKEGFGIASGISFSPDGKEAALLWQQGGDGKFGKIHRFDIEKGVKIGEHVLREEIKPSASGFGNGGMMSFQFLPDGRGWLVSGYQVVERETGKVVWTVGRAPGYKKDVQDRRFVDPYHATTTGEKKFGDKTLTLLPIAPAELDAAFKKAAK